MTSAKRNEQPKTHVMDYTGIQLRKNAPKTEIVEISEKDGFILNTAFTQDFRILKPVYEMLKKSHAALPDGCRLMVYEAYRPLKRQIELWNMVTKIFTEKFPNASETELYNMCETYVSNPYNGIGSGHQAACAVDVALCDKDGNPLDMGTKCQEIHPDTPTMSPGVSPEARRNRDTLLKAMEGTGFLNYPEEWWHYSYGDYAWAVLRQEKEALFGPLDI